MTGRSRPIWTQVPVESTVLSNKDIKFENTGITRQAGPELDPFLDTFKRSVRKIFKLLHRQDVTRRHVVAQNISLTGSQTVDKISAVMSIRA